MIKIGSMKAVFNKIKFRSYTAFIILEDALSMKHAIVDLGTWIIRLNHGNVTDA